MARFLHKKMLLTSVFILVMLGIMSITTMERLQVSPLERVLKDTLAPFQKGVMKVSQSSKNFIDSLLSFRVLKARNDDLETQVADLKTQVTRLREYQMENMRLRELLEFKDNTKGQYKMLPAAVIGRDISNWLNTVSINKGLRDGIQKDMAVVNQKGLVGRVMSVTSFTSEILLIIDARSAVGGLVQLTRTSGVIEGLADETGLVKMIHLPRDAAIKKNQEVLTSGLGGIFPKGLSIGRVYSVEFEPNGLLKYALIRPEVDFNQLEELYVITGGGGR